ncbi:MULTISPECIES: DUF5615 family PIN-like protein [unclassified Thiocapsa]|uniref:DUF5615 family PIN-like protein n=1 Tax=unclassified Thiocapsa TaxID=2641286 RepID=UPI0035B3D402
MAVRDLGLRDSDDRAIFQAARDQGDVVIMSKDSDFVDLALRFGPPPRILWLTCGNVTNIHLRRILAEVLSAARPGYADFSRHPGEADFSPPRGRARATEVARPPGAG